MSDIIYIYTLNDPRNKKPFYVGYSKQPNKRFKAHKSEVSNAVRMGKWYTMKMSYMMELAFEGLQPFMRIVSETDNKNKRADEKTCIRIHEMLGYTMISGESTHYNRRRYGEVQLPIAYDAYSLSMKYTHSANEDYLNRSIELWRKFINKHKDNVLFTKPAKSQLRACLDGWWLSGWGKKRLAEKSA